MVTMSNSIMTINVVGNNGVNTDDVIKRQVGERTFVGYLNATDEQMKSGEFGFFKVFDGVTLVREFRLKDRFSIDSAFRYVKDLNLDSTLETELQVFLLDIETIGSNRKLQEV